MTATYRLKGMGWFVSGVIVALAFYLVSLQVAAERNKLESVNRSIAQAQRDIRALDTEFSTRSNLAQLERWNGEVLALTSPTAAQYVPSEAALASINFGDAGAPQVEMASLVIPSLPSVVTPSAVTSTAAPAVVPAPIPAPARVADVAFASARPAVERAMQAAKPIAARTVETVRTAAIDRGRAQAVAMLDRKLLSDSTLGDLFSGARAETASLR